MKEGLKISEIVTVLSIILLFSSLIYHSRYAAKTNKKVTDLKSQISDLRSENEMLQEDVKILARVAEEKGIIEAELEEVKAGLEEARVEISDLKLDNRDLVARLDELIKHKEALEARLTTVTKEKGELLAILNSLTELKKAVRNVKQRIREERILALRELDKNKLALGNRGFIIKDGKSTMVTKVNIEVLPVGQTSY